MLGIGLKLLGIGKAILGFFLGLVKAIFGWAQRNPLLALAVAVDIVLVAGCWWGYTRHRDALAKDVQITQLKTTVKEKDNLIELLYKRIQEYVQALNEAQTGRVKDIEQHNKAVQELERIANEQIAKAQAEAAKTRAQRDYYFKLSEQYRRNTSNCGPDPAKRIACEEALNGQFIRDIQKVAR